MTEYTVSEQWVPEWRYSRAPVIVCKLFLWDSREELGVIRVVLCFEWQMRSYKYFLLCTSLLIMYLIFICKPITHRHRMVNKGVTLQVLPYCTFPITSSGCISFPYPVPGCVGNMLICTFSKLNDSKGGERLIPLFREDCAYSLMPSKTARCITWAGKRGRLPIILWEEGWCICITQSK